MGDATVLIVDDEPTNLEILNRLLGEHYLVRVAKSGARALAMAPTDPRPDLVLLDVRMPGMDGYTVLSRLQANPATAHIPVIFVTAAEGAWEEEKGFALGAVDYITKPIRPAILLARVRTHLALKKASDFLHDQNAYLEAEVTRRVADNLVLQDVSIRALAHLAETRDTETGDHILRTQSYVQLLAQRLQGHPGFAAVMTDHYVQLVTKSAPLHDIGKVGIPDAILLKPGKLTPSEWAVMQTHAALGARAIERAERDIERPVEFLTLAKEIAHWHHERWDGGGYPDGLTGEAIPISARLMAIADTFDAIVSPRVYQPPRSFETARAIIAAERGRQFDPDVTDAFLAGFDDFVRIAIEHQAGARLTATAQCGASPA